MIGDCDGVVAGPLADTTRGDFPGVHVAEAIKPRWKFWSKTFKYQMECLSTKELENRFAKRVHVICEAYTHAVKDYLRTVHARIGIKLSPAAKILLHSVPQLYPAATEIGVRTWALRTFSCKFSWVLSLAEHSREVQKASMQTNSLALSVPNRTAVWVEYLQFVGRLLTPGLWTRSVKQLVFDSAQAFLLWRAN